MKDTEKRLKKEKKLEETLQKLEETEEKLEKTKNLASEREKILNGEIKELKVERKKLKLDFTEIIDPLISGYDILSICQVGASFEMAICIDVLPSVFKTSKVASLQKLLNIVNGTSPLPFFKSKKEEEIIRSAKSKWTKWYTYLKLGEDWITKTREWYYEHPKIP